MDQMKDVNVPLPETHMSRKGYTQPHQTTTNFFLPQPIFCREYIPNRKMKIRPFSYILANPLPTPTFGKVYVHNRAFFVPYRTVYPAFNAMITQTMYANGSGNNVIPTCVPYTTNDQFVYVCKHASFSTAGTSNNYDFAVLNLDNTVSYHLFTLEGIQFYKFIESIGIKINFNLKDEHVVPLINMLCFFKVMLDWYYPSAYMGDSFAMNMKSQFERMSADKSYGSSDIIGFYNGIKNICYSPDYLVSAFDKPVGPNDSVEGDLVLNDLSNDATYPQKVVNRANNSASPTSSGLKPGNGTPFIGSSYNNSGSASGGVITQYVVDALRAMTDYTRRHTLAGVRELDRYLAEYGVSLSSEVLKRSVYLGSQDWNFEFMQIMSHSDTQNGNNGLPLGGYAGKGSSASVDKVFEADFKEFGCIIIVNTLIPEIAYYQGMHREKMHFSAMDFLHSNFDHMGNRAISALEVYVPQNGSLSIADSTLYNKIFGYAPYYIEYNMPEALLTGLYRIRSRQKLLPCYSLFRDLSGYESGTLNDIKHSIGFVQASDKGQYNRIFLNSKSDAEDQFNAIHRFEVENFDVTLQPYDTYEFDHMDSNKSVSITVNGSKMN